MPSEEQDLVASLKKIEAMMKADAEAFRRIGRFFYEFSQLEFTIRVILAKWIGLEDRYFDATLGTQDFARLCSMVKAVSASKFGADKSEDFDQERAAKFADLANRSLKLNDKRVVAAHGTWVLENQGVAARKVSSSLKASFHFEEVNELDRAADEAQSILRAFLFT